MHVQSMPVTLQTVTLAILLSALTITTLVLQMLVTLQQETSLTHLSILTITTLVRLMAAIQYPAYHTFLLTRMTETPARSMVVILQQEFIILRSILMTQTVVQLMLVIRPTETLHTLL